MHNAEFTHIWKEVFFPHPWGSLYPQMKPSKYHKEARFGKMSIQIWQMQRTSFSANLNCYCSIKIHGGVPTYNIWESDVKGSDKDKTPEPLHFSDPGLNS